MPKQTGIIKITGTIDGLIFYKLGDEYYVRKKGILSKERIANDPVFQRSRENSSEFCRAAKAGKLFRNAFADMVKYSSDYALTARVAKVMTQLKDMDLISQRGHRQVSHGIQSVEGKALLKDFNFNVDAKLDSVILKKYAFDATSGQLDMEGLVTKNDVNIAIGATHVCFRSAWTRIDFEQGVFNTVYSEPKYCPIQDGKQHLGLGFDNIPSLASGEQIFVLQVLFYQEVNGIRYFLKNANFNCMKVIAIV